MTLENGYHVTDGDKFFRRTIERLGIPIESISLRLPRSADFNGSLFPQGLRFLAGKEKRFFRYKRNFLLSPIDEDSGNFSFDFLDEGKMNFETFLKSCVMNEPKSESFDIGLDSAEIYLYVGRNYTFENQRMLIRVLSPMDLASEGFSVPTINLNGKTREECISFAERVVEYHLNPRS